jgi:L-lactate dehydrogenase complex protein LldG
VKNGFPKLLASIRAGLEKHAQPHREENAVAQVPIADAARRAELLSQFANELERVDGRFMGVLSSAQACEKTLALARELDARSVALGTGVALDASAIVRALKQAGIKTIQVTSTSEAQRTNLRRRLATCELAVVEAHYAIASTGTLAVVATADRPGSLTLLPPVNLVLVDAERVLPDMAAVINALGVDTITNHRVAFITGPSRTADIEKMIVLGVHGPKQLYAAAVWRDGAAEAK